MAHELTIQRIYIRVETAVLRLARMRERLVITNHTIAKAEALISESRQLLETVKPPSGRP